LQGHDRALPHEVRRPRDFPEAAQDDRAEDLNQEGVFDEILEKNTVAYQLKKIKTTDFGSLYELVYAVRMDDKTNRKQFLDELRCRNGNLNITLTMEDETRE